jgi:hypothetical protein
MVEKPPPSPQKILLKNKKTSKNFKKQKKTPARLENLWECDANQVFFFYLT